LLLNGTALFLFCFFVLASLKRPDALGFTLNRMSGLIKFENIEEKPLPRFFLSLSKPLLFQKYYLKLNIFLWPLHSIKIPIKKAHSLIRKNGLSTLLPV